MDRLNRTELTPYEDADFMSDTVEQHLASARELGIAVHCSFAVEGLLRDTSGGVIGVGGRMDRRP